jgi:hypothetical protein
MHLDQKSSYRVSLRPALLTGGILRIPDSGALLNYRC